MPKVKGNITKNFTVEEYCVNQTELCEISTKALAHARRLQMFRNELKKPMQVNAWFRTKKYNEKVGGIPTSGHLTGEATDVGFGNVSDAKFNEYAKMWKRVCEKDGVIGEIGRYSWGIHLGSNIKYSKKFTIFDKR